MRAPRRAAGLERTIFDAYAEFSRRCAARHARAFLPELPRVHAREDRALAPEGAGAADPSKWHDAGARLPPARARPRRAMRRLAPRPARSSGTEQLDDRAAGVKPADRLGEQARGARPATSFARRPASVTRSRRHRCPSPRSARRRSAASVALAARREHAVRRRGEHASSHHARGTPAPSRAIVVPPLIRSSTMIATLPSTSPTSASPLTTPSLRYFSANAAPIGRRAPSARRCRNCLRPLDAAGVRRDDADVARRASQRREMRDEQRIRFQVLGAAAERVLVRREIVHVERHDAVGADRLEQLRDVARRDRVARLASCGPCARRRDRERRP